jgi:hypothetical protein
MGVDSVGNADDTYGEKAQQSSMAACYLEWYNALGQHGRLP